jgi:hypothetical protein
MSDVVEKKASAVVKTQCAKLLESFCEKVDGSVTLLATLAISAIRAVLTGDITNKDAISRIPSLAHAAESNFLKLTHEQILETSILSLSTTSYHVSR